MDQNTKDIFRRWGYLRADIDPFERIRSFPHRDIDAVVSDSKFSELKKIYCSKVGTEFMYIPHPDRTDWLAGVLESGRQSSLSQDFILKRLVSAKIFESFLHTKYIGTKRFGLEGLTAAIPLLDSILNQAADQGVEHIMLGMGHRGRLNVMHHIAGTAAKGIFANFEDLDPRSILGSGDVKYHKGATGTYRTFNGKEIDVRIASNPSHLEAVNPVIQGRARARLNRIGDKDKKKVLVICLHGDAAFAGQGITAETLNYMDLPGFRVGGTINIVLNNMIGFTCKPRYLYSGMFATDVAKRCDVPIFHVNGESPDDVVRVGEIAVDYRNEFKSDVVIDLIGYRQYGHNEVDDPSITSPVLYNQLKDHPFLHFSYGKSIGKTEKDVVALEDEVKENLEEHHGTVSTFVTQPAFAYRQDYWKPYCGGPYNPSLEVDTTVPKETLAKIADGFLKLPTNFTMNEKLRRIIELRVEMGHGTKPIDFGSAEALAFGSLLLQNIPVRLTGQDSRRGTFAHRHAVYYDQVSGEQFIPLQHLQSQQGKFDVYDSMLSEAAAVGFEYGFSRDYPEALVCWEAQFGDFVNGAQIIIDQFITAAEDKWTLLSGLVMLLPHGYEGQGPEHSSARIERFLQLAGEDNIQVCQPSTAAQYFHLLRRQVLRTWRKPLIVFTPKSMLRAKPACSNLEELTNGKFHCVIDDEAQFKSAERVLICTGKIRHELISTRAKNKANVAIISLEQMYPFPYQELKEILKQYTNLKSLVWVQEEPANMGALFFVRPFLEEIVGHKRFSSVKRSASASPSTGSPKAHAMEQEALMKLAFAKLYLE